MPHFPHGDNPNRYQINPDDDRALKGTDSAVYLALATALDALDDLSDREEHRPLYLDMAPAARKAVRTAESALRRAAWITVVHAASNEQEPDR